MRWLTSIGALALAGCTTVPVIQAPPEHLMQDCPIPAVQAEKNGDLPKTILAFKAALRSCNDDKAALREWAKEK